MHMFMTDPPPVYNTTISSSTTPDDLSGFNIIISWTVSTYVKYGMALVQCCEYTCATHTVAACGPHMYLHDTQFTSA